MSAVLDSNMGYCRACGKQIHQSALACPGCGAQQAASAAHRPSATEKRILPALLLCFFVGFLGVHRFYVGKVGTGLLMLFTLGGFGIWTLIDFIMIVCGSFKDKEGHTITQWT
jgi:TM2 domain-containing membrane protein YozV